jgi:hypothetical protein
VKQLVEVQ